MRRFVLALDQGTTSSRSILFDHDGDVVATAQREFTQHFPRSGWVEHDAEEIWATQVATVAEVLARAHAKLTDLAAIGIDPEEAGQRLSAYRNRFVAADLPQQVPARPAG